MLQLCKFFLLLILLLVLTPDAPAALGAESAAKAYNKAADTWKSLLNDGERANRRDLWLDLEKRFLEVARHDKGQTGAKANYQAARCREELAKRSHSGEDWRQAANLYMDVQKKFPTNSLADDGLFKAATITAKRLDKPEEARNICLAALDKYPRGDMAKNARSLLASLPADKAQARPASKADSSSRAKASPAAKPSTKPGSGSASKPDSKPSDPGTLIEQLGLTVKTVMIDAGHGGRDPGAMGNGITEKNVTLTLANLLGERLRKNGFSVLHTRRGDSAVALERRPGIANDKKADIFISLHVNSSSDKKVNGLETYFLDIARTGSAATVAARENAISVKSISDLQFILTDLMLSSKLKESRDLASIVHSNMSARLKLAGFTIGDNGVRSAPFYVLMGARMPAVLVEIGYLSHTSDARRIKSPKYLERVADGLAFGIVEYKKKLARFSGR